METQNNTSNTNEVTKKKKGRPKKVITEEQVIPKQSEKKKRGRKKKEVLVEEVKQKKKRGRKAAVKFFSSSIRKQIPLTTVIQDNNNFILHLDINDDDDDVESDITDKATIDSISDILNNNLYKITKDNIKINDSAIDIIQENSDKEIEDQKDDVSVDDVIDIKDIYENRIRSREVQDKLLIEKLEKLQVDENFINKLWKQKQNNKHQVSTNKDNEVKQQSERQDVNRQKGYFEVLYNLVDNDSWLSKTDVACWWCCHNFSTIPIGMPIRYYDSTRKFLVRGIFCSFACMQAYKIDNKVKENGHLINYLYKNLTGKTTSRIIAAPPRCCLKIFGGDLSIDEFRKSSEEEKIYSLIEYPMIPARDYIETIDIMNVKNANVGVFEDANQHLQKDSNNLDEKRIKDAQLRLSSQIEKTTITLGNTIDKFIKFN